MDAARDIVEAAKLAIDGEHMPLEEFEEAYEEQAKLFWKAALRPQ
jgi:hypothetical protein